MKEKCLNCVSGEVMFKLAHSFKCDKSAAFSEEFVESAVSFADV